PTRLRQTGGPRDSATLVRGADTYGHFEPEPRPETDLDPAMLALHAEISDRQARILYRGTEKTSFWSGPVGVVLTYPRSDVDKVTGARRDLRPWTPSSVRPLTGWL